jgi:uncharacterized MnhB-related membrane protein
VSKVTHEVSYPISLSLLCEVLPVFLQTFTTSFANIAALCAVSAVPYMKFFMTDVISVNQFVGYGLIVLVIALAVGKFERPDDLMLG